MRIDINNAVRDMTPARKASETRAENLCKRLGIKRISRRVFEPQAGDVARGRALDRRVREQLLKGLCD